MTHAFAQAMEKGEDLLSFQTTLPAALPACLQGKIAIGAVR